MSLISGDKFRQIVKRTLIVLLSISVAMTIPFSSRVHAESANQEDKALVADWSVVVERGGTNLDPGQNPLPPMYKAGTMYRPPSIQEVRALLGYLVLGNLPDSPREFDALSLLVLVQSFPEIFDEVLSEHVIVPYVIEGTRILNQEAALISATEDDKDAGITIDQKMFAQYLVLSQIYEKLKQTIPTSDGEKHRLRVLEVLVKDYPKVLVERLKSSLNRPTLEDQLKALVKDDLAMADLLDQSDSTSLLKDKLNIDPFFIVLKAYLTLQDGRVTDEERDLLNQLSDTLVATLREGVKCALNEISNGDFGMACNESRVRTNKERRERVAKFLRDAAGASLGSGIAFSVYALFLGEGALGWILADIAMLGAAITEMGHLGVRAANRFGLKPLGNVNYPLKYLETFRDFDDEELVNALMGPNERQRCLLALTGK
jgi:hypothetical protein